MRCKILYYNINISLKNWQRDSQFKEVIEGFRNQGWLDWQILLAMMNFILSVKANQNLLSRKFQSEQENRLASNSCANVYY